MIVSVGEILFDVFPDYRRLGGAPFNFAYHVFRLGIPTAFLTRIGKDEAGREVLDTLSGWGFPTEGIQIDFQYPTGTVDVVLDASGVPTFTIRSDVAYDHLALSDDLLRAMRPVPQMVYFGTLVQRTEGGFETVQSVLRDGPPGTKRFYDMNLRPDSYNRQIVIASLQQTDVLKLNDEELATAGDMLDRPESGADLVDHLMQAFDIETVAVTRGARGSELFYGGNRFAGTAGSAGTVVDTVGAGDAYAAMLAVGYLAGWPGDRIVSLAERFAGRICRVEGALPPDNGLYDEFRKMSDGDSHGAG